MIKTIVLLLLAVLLPRPAEAQALPDEMVATFNQTWADDFFVPTGPGDEVSCRLTYANSGESGKVILRWRFAKANAVMRTMTQTVEVSFRPTGVAKRAGETSTFYVAGWSERTGRVIIEEWAIGQFLLGSALPVGGSTVAVSTMSIPPITRVVEWVSDAGEMPPLWDIACQTYGNALLLLASGTPTVIWSLNLTTHNLAPLYSSDIHPALLGHRMLEVGKHSTAGFVVLTERRKQWEHAQYYSQVLDYFILRDVNLDGMFDVEEVVPNDEFHYVFPAPWIAHYSE